MAPSIIRCEYLFDGESVIKDAVVTIEADRISGVNNSGDFNEDAQGTISCHFLMPGLIDAHAHISGYKEGIPAGAPFAPMKNFMRLLIYNGVTSVRDTGNSIETIKYLNEWQEKYNYPQVFSSGPLLDAPPLTWAFSRIVRDAADARREVGLLSQEGMNFIKAYRNITKDVLVAIVEYSRENGKNVAIDCHMTTAAEAIDAGVNCIEHAVNLLDADLAGRESDMTDESHIERIIAWGGVDIDGPQLDELIGKMTERKTHLCPTLLVSQRWCFLEDIVSEPNNAYMSKVMPYHQYFSKMRGRIGMAIGRKYIDSYLKYPELDRSSRSKVIEGFEKINAVVKKMYERKINIVIGTDSPNPSIVPGFSLHQEMNKVASAGVSTIDVLTSVTSRTADLLKEADIGRIQPGAMADLLLLNGNPIDDIGQVGNICEVIKSGKVVDRKKVIDIVMESG